MHKPEDHGPVNAHLISGPTISTNTSFAKFDFIIKCQDQLRSIIYIYLDLEYIILHAKFHDHRTISYVGDFGMFLPYVGVTAIFSL